MKLLVFALAVSAVCAESFYASINFKPIEKKFSLYDSKLLHQVQMAGVFPKSKDFVDLHMKYEEKVILSAFDELMSKTHNRPTKENLSEFINRYFDSESELDLWTPTDFVAEPAYLADIKDPQLREFAKNMNGIWASLGRKMKPAVLEHPEQFSMIPVRNGFVVPGSNFKELYYRDAYWMIAGLLISDMKETAKGMISNFIDLEREFGHIPSGNRYYYLGRSSPPMLSAMMAIYLQQTDDIEFLRDNIDALESELEYWLDTHSVVFNVNGREHSLLRYSSPATSPRPEEYSLDYSNAQIFESEQRQQQYYTDIKSASESGWIFSSRWLMNKNGSNVGDLSNIRTIDILPVDLNAIFANALQNVEVFYSHLGDSRKGVHWQQIRKRWINSMKEVMWNEDDGIWYDWDLPNSRHRKYFYISNVSPLWMGVVEPEFLKAKSQKILNYLRKNHVLEFPGGVPVSLTKSQLPWDLPNAWPSQVSVLVSALESLQTEESSKMAFEVAATLVRSIYKVYLADKQLYEKYDVELPGKLEIGGRHDQEGYGGTAGVITEMLAKYGASLTSVKGNEPFPSKFPQNLILNVQKPQESVYNQHHSTSFPVKPLNPVTPVHFGPASAKPFASTHFAQSTYLPAHPTKPVKPDYVTLAPFKPDYIAQTKPEYVSSVEVTPSTQVKPEFLTIQGNPEIATVKPTQEFVSPTYKPESVPKYPNKPLYDSSVEARPQYISSTTHEYLASPLKPEVVPIGYTKPSYIPPTPVKPEYVPSVEAKPVKPLYFSFEKKPQYVSTIKPDYSNNASVKPTYIPSFEAKPELVSGEYAKPSYVSQDKIKPDFESVPNTSVKHVTSYTPKPSYTTYETKPQINIFSAKPTYIAPVPFKSEYSPSLNAKPESVSAVYNKPSYSSTVPTKPSYVPSVEAKPQSVSVENAKPVYLSHDEVKPEFDLSTPSDFDSVPTTSAKPEYVTSYPAKPLLVSSLEIKPQYSSSSKPTYLVSASVKPEYNPLIPSKPVSVPEIYTKPSYVASAAIKPDYFPSVSSAKPELASVNFIKPSYVSKDEVKPEFDLSTPSEFDSVSTTTKPEYLTSYPAKPVHVSSFEIKQQNLSPAVPTFIASLPVKSQWNSAAYTKPSYFPTTSVPENAFTTTSKPEHFTLYPTKHTYISHVEHKPQYVSPVKPDYSASAPIKTEYIAYTPKPSQNWQFEIKPQKNQSAQVDLLQSEPKPEYITAEQVPTKEVYIQSEPTKPTFISKPFFTPTKPALVSAVPLNAFPQISYDSGFYQKPSHLIPTVSETKYTTPHPVSTEYGSSTVTESSDEYSTPAPFKPEYTTLAEPEYISTTQSDLGYSTTESQYFDATLSPVKPTDKTQVKPGYGYFVSAAAKPDASPLSNNYSPSTPKPYYTTVYRVQKEEPKFTSTYATSAPSKFHSLTEVKPTFNVLIPAKSGVAQSAANLASSEQQAHFSYIPEYNKPAFVVTPTKIPSLSEVKPASNLLFSSKPEVAHVSANFTSSEQKATILQQSHFSYFPEQTKPAVVATSAPTELPILTEVKPTIDVLVEAKPEEAQVAANLPSSDQKATILQQSHFSYFPEQTKPTFVAATLAPTHLPSITEVKPTIDVLVQAKPEEAQVGANLPSSDQKATILQQSHFSYFPEQTKPQLPSITEVKPTIDVLAKPEEAQVAANIPSSDQKATILQQSHFSYFPEQTKPQLPSLTEAKPTIDVLAKPEEAQVAANLPSSDQKATIIQQSHFSYFPEQTKPTFVAATLAPTQLPSLTEVKPTIDVLAKPEEAQIAANLPSSDQKATILQQSHFSYFPEQTKPQIPSVTEVKPTIDVLAKPEEAQVAANLPSSDQKATILQQSHFSYFPEQTKPQIPSVTEVKPTIDVLTKPEEAQVAANLPSSDEKATILQQSHFSYFPEQTKPQIPSVTEVKPTIDVLAKPEEAQVAANLPSSDQKATILQQSHFSYFPEQIKPQIPSVTEVKPTIDVLAKPEEAQVAANLPSSDQKATILQHSHFSYFPEQTKPTFVAATLASTQLPSLTEVKPTIEVLVQAKPEEAQVAANLPSSQQKATILQQSQFSTLNKPAAVVGSSSQKTAGFTSQFTLNTTSANSPFTVNKYSNSAVSKPKFSFGTSSTGFAYNKAVAPTLVSTTVDVTGTPVKTGQKWQQNGQYVQNSWSGSSYVKPSHGYYSNLNKHTSFNVNSGQYQPQHNAGQYQSQYKSGQYNSGLYTNFKPSTVKPVTFPFLHQL